MIPLVAGGAALGAAVGHLVRRRVWRVVGMQPPPMRLPWLEVVGAELFALAGALRAKDLALAAAAGAPLPTGEIAGLLGGDAVFLALLLALAAIDVAYKYLPDELTYAGVALGVALAFASPPAGVGRGGALVASLLAAAIGAGALGGLRLLTTRLFGLETMGLGDVKLIALVGAFMTTCGPLDALEPSGTPIALRVLEACIAGMLFGTAAGLAARAVTGKPHFAFGPALAAGGAATRLAAHRMEAAWRGYARWSQQLGPGFALGVCVVGLAVCVWLVWRVRQRASEIRDEVEADYDRLDAQADGEAPADEGAPAPTWLLVLAALAPLGLLGWVLAAG